MEPQDIQPFLEALTEMGELFADELSELRQRSYWRVLHTLCTLEEWRYACTQAMTREAFHKVPLPATLLEYVREYRRAAREARLQDWSLDGLQSREHLFALRAQVVSKAEIEALIASVWPEERQRATAPSLAGTSPTPEEALRYEPTEDPDEAKRKARAQLRSLQEPEALAVPHHKAPDGALLARPGRHLGESAGQRLAGAGRPDGEAARGEPGPPAGAGARRRRAAAGETETPGKGRMAP